MLKIWSMKKEQQKADNADAISGKKKKVKAAELRVQKDIAELSLPNTMKLEYKDADDILNFKLIIKPDEGMYVGGEFPFEISVPQSYPHEAPKVRCVPTIYHPNIDLEGKVCLNILREEWKPVLNLNTIFIGLQFLFDHPNEHDPLNKEAADEMRKDKAKFERDVKTSMRGGRLRNGNSSDATEYTRVLAVAQDDTEHESYIARIKKHVTKSGKSMVWDGTGLQTSANLPRDAATGTPSDLNPTAAIFVPSPARNTPSQHKPSGGSQSADWNK